MTDQCPICEDRSQVNSIFVPLALRRWNDLTVNTPSGLQPLTAPRDGSLGVLMVYATEAEAEAAFPGADVLQFTITNRSHDAR